ncbi:MAG: family 78 glycoside hydrolase catalytic domain [bacterium]
MKKSAKYFFVFVLCGMFLFMGFSPGGSSSNLHPAYLRCEKLIDPQGIDIIVPALSWYSESDYQNQIQTAYQIIVASSLEKLEANEGDLWDSEKVYSNQSINIVYQGKTLLSGMQCFWKVKVWDSNGNESNWSQSAKWSMGFLNMSDWEANWIGLERPVGNDKPDAENTHLSARMLRKEFEADNKVRRATAYICGLGLFELYINGEKIGDQVLAPALSEYQKKSLYMTFDVTKNIAEKNAVGVILGNGRYFEPRHSPPFKLEAYNYPKMIFRLDVEYVDGSKQSIVSDETWKLTADGPITANNEFDGEEYDATKEMHGWNKPGFDDSKWMTAEVVSEASPKLIAQMNEPIKIMEVIQPVSFKEIQPGVYIYDMGQNMVGWVSLKMKGERGSKVMLRFAETLKSDGCLYMDNLRSAKVTDTYTLKGEGEEFWEPRFTYHGFRYVEITGFPGKPDINTIEGKVVYDNLETTGTFNCSNETINKIFKNAYWGIRGNYRGIPTDCPQRDERQGWLGDRAVGSGGESFIFDNAKLYAKWLGDIDDAQDEKGRVPAVAPTYWKVFNDDITWPAAYYIIADMLYEKFGDIEPIRKHYESMKKYLFYLRDNYMKDDIMPRDQYGDWCMPPESPELIHSNDPSRKTSGEFLGTVFYYRLAKLMEKFSVLLNNGEANAFTELAARTKKGFLNTFYNPQSNELKKNTSTACVFGLAYDLVPEEARKNLFANLVAVTMGEFNGHISTGLVGAQWLMRTLSDNGRADIAYKLATNTTYPSWGYMAENGATTIWELWNGNTAAPDMNSGNHVMLLGDLIIWFYEYLAGIKTDPTMPAFKHIIMKAFPFDELKYVNASYISMYGVIKSEWKLDGKIFSWEINIPANTSATIFIPAEKESDVSVDGKLIWEIDGIKLVKIEDGRAVYEIGSGAYNFISKNCHVKFDETKYIDAPKITPGDTTIALQLKVFANITCTTNDAIIRYTIDGTEPDETSPIFDKPFEIKNSINLQAKAFKEGYKPSFTKSALLEVYDAKVNGLNYNYYEGSWETLPDFNTLTPAKTGLIPSIDIDKIKFRGEYFAYRFTGSILIPKDGEYTFYISSDDGSKLYIDDKLIITNDGKHAMVTRSGSVKLTAGKHPITIEFFQGSGGLGLMLEYSSDSLSRSKVPISSLYFD